MAVSLRSSSSSRIVVRAAIVPVSVLLHADRTLTGRLRDVETITRIVPSGSMWFPIPVTCIYYLWSYKLMHLSNILEFNYRAGVAKSASVCAFNNAARSICNTLTLSI